MEYPEYVTVAGYDVDALFQHGYVSFMNGVSVEKNPLRKDVCPDGWASWVLGWDEAAIDLSGSAVTVH